MSPAVDPYKDPGDLIYGLLCPDNPDVHWNEHSAAFAVSRRPSKGLAAMPADPLDSGLFCSYQAATVREWQRNPMVHLSQAVQDKKLVTSNIAGLRSIARLQVCRKKRRIPRLT